MHKLRQDIPLRLHHRNVTGHQDRVRPQQFSRLETLNIVAGEAAKTMTYQIERQRHLQSTNTTPLFQWKIRTGDRFIKKNIREEIKDIVQSTALKEFWLTKGKFVDNTISTVDWLSLRQAVKRKTTSHQRWAAKFVSGFCGSYYKLHQMGKHESPLYPRC